jgi:hypothetical protein
VRTRLDPEEALAGPLYLVAALLVVVPVVDYVLSVPPPQLSDVQWRFAAVGLLTNHTLTPILGLAMAFVISAFLKQHAIQRLLVVSCLLIATILIALSLGFVLDVMQVRASVPEEGRAAFNSAWKRALIKLALTTGALAYMGLRARRMIPARNRQHTPKPVHVVSK